MQFHPSSLEDTIVALATPPGIGAIGIIRLSGNRSIEICNEVFDGADLRKQASHTIHYGHIAEEGLVIDEVMVSIFREPRSYTKENIAEISCHGSRFIQQKLIECFLHHGARLATAGEFTLRAFLHGRIDLSQAEGVADLIASDSDSSHRVAMKQMRGGVSKQIAELREQLLHFASLVELELDFSEEDVEFADRSQLEELIREIKSLISGLLASFKLGNAIKNGVATVIAGRPNAGKSTLLNALLNEERAIVSEIPGTTRDTIEEEINIEGIIFRLIDTAGIRDATDKIEHIGIERTFEKIRQSAIVVYVFDAADLSAEALQKDLDRLRQPDIPLFIIGNKLDLVDEELIRQKFRETGDILWISSKEKTNLEHLKDQLFLSVFDKHIKLENTIVTNVRHLEALKKADEALSEVLIGMQEQLSGELLALDIRRSLEYLGEITGEVTTEDLLGNIFGKFCIGK